MMKLLEFVAFLGGELAELWTNYKADKFDEEAAQQSAMRMVRKISDEIALREIQGRP